ncbi:transcriptional regulator, LysR family [Bordetella bronchiseptica E010]|nr:transcriptional regulator, LysR family [Bordetella bronchiseptica E010]
MKTANPPLVSLRAFVAVARHESFTQAAGTLGITQGAVSHHVATLETYADCRLFDRRGSTVALTPAGLQLYEAVKDAMSTIELTMQLLVQRGHRHDRLKVRTSMPSFAMTLVVPHLGTYSAAHGVQVPDHVAGAAAAAGRIRRADLARPQPAGHRKLGAGARGTDLRGRAGRGRRAPRAIGPALAHGGGALAPGPHRDLGVGARHRAGRHQCGRHV